MICENYFKDLFEPIPDYRQIVLLLFFFPNDNDLLHEIGFSERNINCLKVEFKNMLKKQHEEYLDYIKNEEESTVQRF